MAEISKLKTAKLNYGMDFSDTLHENDVLASVECTSVNTDGVSTTAELIEWSAVESDQRVVFRLTDGQTTKNHRLILVGITDTGQRLAQSIPVHISDIALLETNPIV